jgi:hypothetical protein
MSQMHARRVVLALTLLGGLAAARPGTAAAQAPQQDNTGYGTTSAEFLLLGAGARGVALGGSFAAIATDVSALYYNPAGSALMTRPGAMVSTYEYVADTRYSWGGVALPFAGGTRSFGVQIGTFGFSGQPVYTAEQPNGTGATYSVNETFGGLTLAQNFSDRFSAGLTAKFISDNLGDASGTAFAVDFGTNFHAMLNNHPIKFAFTLTNLGTNLSYSGDALNAVTPREPIPGEDEVPSLPQPSELRTKDFPLPTTFRVALAYDLLAGETSRLTLLSDFSQSTSNKAGFAVGSEFASSRLGGSGFGFALRGSYSYQPANNIDLALNQTALDDEEKLHGLAVGGGLNYNTGNFNLGLDYAFRYQGILGGTNFFTFSLGW